MAILCDLFGMVKWPFQRLSDLQRSGIKRSRLESPGNHTFLTPVGTDKFPPKALLKLDFPSRSGISVSSLQSIILLYKTIVTDVATNKTCCPKNCREKKPEITSQVARAGVSLPKLLVCLSNQGILSWIMASLLWHHLHHQQCLLIWGWLIGCNSNLKIVGNID